MDEELQLAFEKYCNLVYQYLLSNCPVDTGNMITHIRMNNDGNICKIIIDTMPYSKAGKSVMRKMRKRQRVLHPKEVEYAAYTEYKKTRNEGWVRERSLREAAYEVADRVFYGL